MDNCGDTCHEYAECSLAGASATCKCISGFTGDGSNCEDVNECANSSPVCTGL